MQCSVSLFEFDWFFGCWIDWLNTLCCSVQSLMSVFAFIAFLSGCIEPVTHCRTLDVTCTFFNFCCKNVTLKYMNINTSQYQYFALSLRTSGLHGWIKGALLCLFYFLTTCARLSCILSFRVHVKLFYRIVLYCLTISQWLEAGVVLFTCAQWLKNFTSTFGRFENCNIAVIYVNQPVSKVSCVGMSGASPRHWN